MTHNQFAFFAIISLCAVLIMTNPKEDDHKAVLKTKLTKLFQKGVKKHTESDGLLSMLGQGVGLVMGSYFVDKVVDNVSRENYFLFSTTTITWEGETQNVGIGILGNVFLSSQFDKELDKMLEDKQLKTSNIDQSDTNRENKSRHQLNSKSSSSTKKQFVPYVEKSANNTSDSHNTYVINLLPHQKVSCIVSEDISDFDISDFNEILKLVEWSNIRVDEREFKITNRVNITIEKGNYWLNYYDKQNSLLAAHRLPNIPE